MRRAALAVMLGCGGEDKPRSPGEAGEDTAAPDAADSGEEAGDSGEDSGGDDTAPPIDSADTGPLLDSADSGDSGDSADTAPPRPPVDCENLPATPVAFTTLSGFTTAEDFTFDGAGAYVAFDGTNLVSVTYDGVKTVLVPTSDVYPAGVHMLADGDIVIGNGSSGVLRMGMDGSRTTILTGVTSPNGLTVSVDNVVYVSGHGDGKVYEVDPDTGDFSVIATGLAFSNGIAFSPDNQTLYVCSYSLGTVWALDRDGKGGWQAPRVLHDMSASLDGLNVDECGNVYVTDFGSGKVWRIDPDDPATAVLVAATAVHWIPNLHWGRGLGGFDDRTLYVADRDHGALIALEVGVGSTPQAFVPPAE